MSKRQKKNFRSDLKVIVIGTSGTGKTSFVNKWTKNIFEESYKATVVSEFGFKVYEQDGCFYRIHIWDLVGQDQNATITKIFAKDAHGVVVMADATNRETLEDTKKWKNSVDEVASFLDGGKLPCILVENKIDLISSEDRNDHHLKTISEENGFIGYFQTSAKENINIDQAMVFLIKEIIRRMETINVEGKNVFNIDRHSVSLDNPNKNQNNHLRRDDDGCC